MLAKNIGSSLFEQQNSKYAFSDVGACCHKLKCNKQKSNKSAPERRGERVELLSIEYFFRFLPERQHVIYLKRQKFYFKNMSLCTRWARDSNKALFISFIVLHFDLLDRSAFKMTTQLSKNGYFLFLKKHKVLINCIFLIFNNQINGLYQY